MMGEVIYFDAAKTEAMDEAREAALDGVSTAELISAASKSTRGMTSRRAIRVWAELLGVVSARHVSEGHDAIEELDDAETAGKAVFAAARALARYAGAVVAASGRSAILLMGEYDE